MDAQLDVAQQNLFDYLMAKGHTDVEATKVLKLIFSGKDVRFQLLADTKNGDLLALEDEDRQRYRCGAASPVSSCGSVSPSSSAPQFRDEAHYRKEERAVLNVHVGSNVQDCLSSTKPVAAARDVTKDCNACSPAACSTCLSNVDSPGLSVVGDTPAPIKKFDDWLASFLAAGVCPPMTTPLQSPTLGITPCTVAIEASKNMVAQTTPPAEFRPCIEFPPQSVELTPLAEPSQPVPLEAWADFLEPFLSTPCSTAGLAEAKGGEKSGSSSTYVSTVSHAPPRMSFAEWRGLQQQSAGVTDPAASLELSLNFLASSLHHLALTDDGTACTAGGGRGILQSVSCTAAHSQLKQQQQLMVAAATAAAVGLRAKAGYAQGGHPGGIPGSPISCRRASAPPSPG